METNSALVQLKLILARLTTTGNRPLSLDELNSDCILEVLKFLNFKDLMSMCQLDDENDRFFTSLVNGYIIGKVLVPFEIGCNVNQEAETNLRTFGKSIRRLRITMQSANFNAVAKMIIAYCSSDRIKELQLRMCDKMHCSFGGIDIDWDLMGRAIPYLRAIKHLQIDGLYDRAFGDFCVFLLNQAENLETLKLANFSWKNHVNETTMERTKLKELRIDGVIGLENDVFVSLIKKSPQLEVFEFKNCTNFRPMYGETLARYCPNLRYFSDVSNGHQNDVNYYNFLKHFNHLEVTTISLNSWDADDIQNVPVEILINKNSLRKLTMFVNKKCRVVITDTEPDNCTNSSTKLTDAEFHFDESSNIAEWKELLQSCRSSLGGVRRISLSGTTVHNIPEILQYTPYVQEVSIHALFIHRLPAEVRKIKRIIGEIVGNRRNGGQSDKVQFVVNQHQMKEFKVLKNYDELITLSEGKPQVVYRYY